jgi:hypothetical protein
MAEARFFNRYAMDLNNRVAYDSQYFVHLNMQQMHTTEIPTPLAFDALG